MTSISWETDNEGDDQCDQHKKETKKAAGRQTKRDKQTYAIDQCYVYITVECIALLPRRSPMSPRLFHAYFTAFALELLSQSLCATLFVFTTV